MVVFGSGSGSGSDAATKDLVKAQGARGVMETVCEKGKGRLEVGETGMGRKRRAESVSSRFLGFGFGLGRDADGYAGTCCGVVGEESEG